MSALRQIDSPEQKQLLLRVARQTAEDELRVARQRGSEAAKLDGRFGGAFVTFWAEKRLRGCVGTFAATDDIVRTVRQVTREALGDRRFLADPITAEELPSLNIELSLLSDLEPTQDPASLIPGVHGIVISRGGRSGCFLPKVASERGWSAEEFLSNCCTMKASLEADAWRDRGTEVALFTAQVFSEAELG